MQISFAIFDNTIYDIVKETFTGKKLVRSVEKGKSSPPLGTAKIKD